MNEFHGLLNLEFLKIQVSSTDFAASFVFCFKDELMCSNIVLECKGVHFVKLFKEVFSFEFGLLLMSGGGFIMASMQLHELILFFLKLGFGR